MSTPRPVVEFDFVRAPALPPLAWCVELEDNSTTARVIHGRWVETAADGFFEGAWAGPFEAREFDSAFMTGTGARLRSDELLFVAPNHTLDRLYSLRNGDTMYVSNSLPFVLARAGDALDPKFLYYDSYVASIRYGLNRYERRVPTRLGLSLVFHCGCNVRLNRGRELVERRKSETQQFGDYAEYSQFLRGSVALIAANALDGRRIKTFTPLATVSRGYDSPAALALATGVGCKEALAFRDSRGSAGDEDCGSPIAAALGVSVREFGRFDYRTHGNFPEVLIGGGPGGFLSFANALQGRLLFTGFNGDKIWDKNCDKVTRELTRSDASGVGLTELRLRAGFFHLPVPFIGADSHPSIHSISNSAELRPWSIGGSYDRPIARRIAEQAGIPRQLFGRKKQAAGIVVTSEGLAATMSEASFQDFARYADDNWSKGNNLKMGLLAVIKRLVNFNERLTRAGARVSRSLGITGLRFPAVVPHRLAMLAFGYLGRESLLFHWGVEKLIGRYKDEFPA